MYRTSTFLCTFFSSTVCVHVFVLTVLKNGHCGQNLRKIGVRSGNSQSNFFLTHLYRRSRRCWGEPDIEPTNAAPKRLSFPVVTSGAITTISACFGLGFFLVFLPHCDNEIACPFSRLTFRLSYSFRWYRFKLIHPARIRRST